MRTPRPAALARLLLVLSPLVLSPLAAGPAAAQTAAPARPAGDGGTITRLFALRARDGAEAEFEAGYRRHLDWHVAAGDSLPWYLWEIADGERAGTYVDGVIGHPWAAFDRTPDPAGDVADNVRNVEPHAVRPWNGAWRARPDLGGTVAPERARLQVVAELALAPGTDPAAVARALGGADRGGAWLERVSGGEAPALMLWLPAANLAEAGPRAERLVGALTAGGTGISRVRVELWRFRPDLSICRSAGTGCHAVAPAGGKRG